MSRFQGFNVMHGQAVHNGQTVLQAPNSAWGRFWAVLVKLLPALAVHSGQTQSTGKTI